MNIHILIIKSIIGSQFPKALHHPSTWYPKLKKKMPHPCWRQVGELAKVIRGVGCSCALPAAGYLKFYVAIWLTISQSLSNITKKIINYSLGHSPPRNILCPTPRTHMVVHNSVTPVTGDPMPRSDLCGQQEQRWCINIRAGKTFTHIIIKTSKYT